MAEEPKKYDPRDLIQMVKDRVKAEYVSMIPDDQWEQMIQREVDEFFQVRNQGYDQRRCSDFQNIVREELNKKAREETIKLIEEKYPQMYSNLSEGIDNAMFKFIGEKGGELFAMTIYNNLISVLESFKNNLRNMGLNLPY